MTASGGFLGLKHLRAMQKDYLAWSQQLCHDLGDVACVRIGPQRVIQLSHPRDIQEVLVAQAKAFEKTPRTKQIFRQWSGDGLFLAEGDQWARQRRILQPAFTPRILESYVPQIVSRTRKTLASHAGTTSDAAHVFGDITLQTVAESILGTEIQDLVPGFRETMKTLNEVGYRQFVATAVWPTWWPSREYRRLRDAIQFLRGVVDNVIAQRKESNQPSNDLLTWMLSAVDSEDGRGLGIEEVRAQVITLLLAGMDTTSVTLQWTVYLLAKHIDILQRAKEEIDSVCSESPISAEHIDKLEFLGAVLNESMRMYPAAYLLSRTAKHDLTIAEQTIKRGDLISLNVLGVHRDPRWFENPESFTPERFLNPEAIERGKLAFMPFGLGPRACIGKRLANQEALTVLAVLLREFSFELSPPDQKPQPTPQLALHPLPSIKLRLENRR